MPSLSRVAALRVNGDPGDAGTLRGRVEEHRGRQVGWRSLTGGEGVVRRTRAGQKTGVEAWAMNVHDGSEFVEGNKHGRVIQGVPPAI